MSRAYYASYILAQQTITSTISNSTISNNIAARAGGLALGTGPGTNNITVNDTTITGNRARTEGTDQTTGVAGGAGLIAGVNLTMNRVTFSNNTADRDAGGFGMNGGTATFNDVTVNNNIVTSTSGGAAGGNAGGIGIAGGTFTMLRGTINTNTAGADAGAIGMGKGGVAQALGGGKITLTDVTINGNSAGRDAGGFGVSYDSGETATISRTTFSANKAARNAGGVGARSGNGSSTLTNVTVSGGTATQQGGGIGATAAAVLNFINATIASNGAPTGGNIINSGGTINLRSTIVANPTQDGNCSGPVTSGGFNLEFPGTTCNLEVKADPKLGPLQNNGGQTFTHALLTGSAAIDAVQSGCPPPAEDQRAIARPLDGDSNGVALCDIGAFEAAVGTGGLVVAPVGVIAPIAPIVPVAPVVQQQ